MNVDVLNLEWTSYSSRDREMATLINNYLRMHGVSVVEGSIFDFRRLLRKYRPQAVFMTNTVGAPENYEAMRYATERQFLGISLISEGNLLENKEYVSEMIWGWNKDKVLRESLHLQWSERSRQITLKQHPELRGRVGVSGGVGFDRYKIIPPVIQKTFLSKYGKDEFTKVIGIGCWDFGIFYPEDHRFAIFRPLYSDKDFQSLRSDGISFNQILNKIIKENTEILFLLKEHPGVMLGRKASAIEGLEKYPNVLILKNEESIFDCIAVSDFWLIFESTTALEAWLLGKQTCLLNPSGPDFLRDIIHSGSPCYLTAEEFQRAIDAFYTYGDLPGFEEKKLDRRRVIEDVIQWDDGLNHVRAGNEILDLLEKHRNMPRKGKTRINFAEYPRYIRERLRYLSFRFRKSCRDLVFSEVECRNLSAERMQQQLRYYERLRLSKESLRQVRGFGVRS